MLTINQKQTRTSTVAINAERAFRVNPVAMSRRRANLTFLNNSLLNPMETYELITEPLLAGTYQMKVKSVDNLNNINDGVGATGIVGELTYPPTDLAVDLISGNDVTLSWVAPEDGTTPVSYVIYGNGGSGYVIDRTVELYDGVSNPKTVTVTDGRWIFIVETRNAISDSINYKVVTANVGVDDIPNQPGTYPNDPPLDTDQTPETPINVDLRNVSVGKCRLSLIWTYGNNADWFRVYWDSGTGTIDWVNHVSRFARQDSIEQVFTTDQLVSTDVDTDCLFGIRAENSDGVVEENEVEYFVVLDGKAPDEASEVTMESI